MKKKFFAKLFSAIMAIFFTFGTTACGNNSVSGGDDTDTTPPATEPSDTQKPDDDKKPENPEMPDHFGENADFRYLVKGNQVTIIKWLNETDTEVIIPEIIENNAVTSIGDYAFYKCDWLINITIPNNVTTIESYAFAGCRMLRNIIIGNEVSSIGDYAFSNCPYLKYNTKDNLKYLGNLENKYLYLANTTDKMITKAQIDENCRFIGPSAFEDSLITTIAIPNGVISIDSAAFYNCSGLTSITIPNSVTSIGCLAFYACSRLKAISIPNSISNIGSNAFDECNSLTYNTKNNLNYLGNSENLYLYLTDSIIKEISTVNIDENCKFIGSSAFEDSQITNIAIPNGVISIDRAAFYNCSGLTNITIPNSVTSIGDSTFKWCVKLTSITLPNSLTSIGDSAFEYCRELKSITIPNSVTFIGDSAFSGCSSLPNITIPDGVTSIGCSAFYGCIGLTSITIPNSVTTIDSAAFYNCIGLTSVTIPNSVTSIGNQAFAYCNGLTSITLPNSLTFIGENAFYNLGRLEKVYYKGNISEWKRIRIFDSSLTSDIIYYYSETQPATIGNYWHYNANGEIEKW